MATYETTIDELYTYLAQRFQDLKNNDIPDWDYYLTSIDITWHETLPVMKNVQFNYYQSDYIAVDGNDSYEIRNFTVR